MKNKLTEESNKHCSDCFYYETIPPYMFCKYLQKRITARKKPCRKFRFYFEK